LHKCQEAPGLGPKPVPAYIKYKHDPISITFSLSTEDKNVIDESSTLYTQK